MMQHQHQLLEEKPFFAEVEEPLLKSIYNLQKMLASMTNKVSAMTSEKRDYIQLNRQLRDRNNLLALVRPGDITLNICTKDGHTSAPRILFYFQSVTTPIKRFWQSFQQRQCVISNGICWPTSCLLPEAYSFIQSQWR